MTYAYIEERSAWLSSEFGEKMARHYFGDQVIDELPRYVRGKRKGQIKGKLCWLKVERGGWVHGFHSPVFGHVEGKYVERRKGSVIAARLIMPVWGGHDELLHTWEKSKPNQDEQSQLARDIAYSKKWADIYDQDKQDLY